MSFSKHLPLLAGLVIVLYRIVRRPTAGERVGGVLGLAAGLAPAVWLVGAGIVSAKIVVGYATVFFFGSVLLKMAIYLGVMAHNVLLRSTPLVGGILQGILSASCELGAAAVAFGFVFSGLDFPAILGFGAGAAALEAVIVSLLDAQSIHAGGPNAKLVETQIAVLRQGPAWVSVMSGFADRAIANTLHIACRGLVGVGIATATVWPGVCAFAIFASVDGFTMYCLRSGWEFGHARVALRLYGTLAVLSTASIAGLVIAT